MVQELSEHVEKAMTTLAKTPEKSEEAGKEMLDVDHDVEERCGKIDEAAEMVEGRRGGGTTKRGRHRNVAREC